MNPDPVVLNKCVGAHLPLEISPLLSPRSTYPSAVAVTSTMPAETAAIGLRY